jgi:uncharacterized MAPEG superfamily protein
MNQAVLAVLVAGFLPIVCAGIAKAGAKDYDNHQPRAWLEHQQGRRARANAAQQNSFEAFAFFAAAVALAMAAGVDRETLATTAWFFIATRIAYIVCYVADWATARSLVWTLGLAACIRIYWLAI